MAECAKEGQRESSVMPASPTLHLRRSSLARPSSPTSSDSSAPLNLRSASRKVDRHAVKAGQDTFVAGQHQAGRHATQAGQHAIRGAGERGRRRGRPRGSLRGMGVSRAEQNTAAEANVGLTPLLPSVPSVPRARGRPKMTGRGGAGIGAAQGPVLQGPGVTSSRPLKSVVEGVQDLSAPRLISQVDIDMRGTQQEGQQAQSAGERAEGGLKRTRPQASGK
uniref:Uncharacterized protein n=1 Tax=Chromera velia CCMP2878 TaxID=1169474 RepID=A0A0G4GWR3_9ALVE|eukprot:Cvel_23714.t1-p1 / transcript=Cvel_23714.t1 / gene=Cvel_23714 / organism=Chromera_velia_CCMP2878 / gene_product=hypothetical protein / transcript_product=hypothetical protein / location=Cvel_scaffold2477:89-748(-) / protein_length=220 / sequence_SO=supercontig / SO=protein_coding / is_pseudo=false